MTDINDMPIQQINVKLPCELEVAPLDMPDGQNLVVILRTPAGEARAVVDKQAAKSWARTLDSEADKLSSSGRLVIATGHLPNSIRPNGGRTA